jgi:hypothetical protein
LAGRRSDRPEPHKPETETELPDSAISPDELQAAIRRERARRADRHT